ncbi:MAG TPA: PAS-domain containing protein [Hyphomicrobiales bacterium]|nr:PAS-domain containing protein [Hyphomicrobiales bacterium]
MPDNNLRDALDNQNAVNAIMRLALSGRPLRGILEETIRTIFSVNWLKASPKGAIFLTDPSSDELVLTAEHQISPRIKTLCARVPHGHCLCGRAAVSGKIEFAPCVDHRHEISYEGMSQHGHYSVPILDPQGKVLGVFVLYLSEGHEKSETELEFLEIVAGTLATVIGRKRIEAARDRLAHIVEETNCEVYEFDPVSLKLVHANKAALRNLGYGFEELQALRPTDISPGVDQQTFNEMLAPLAEGKVDSIRFETVQRRKDGSTYDVDVNIHRHTTDDVVTCSAIVVDISEQQRLTKLLKATIANFPGGISVIDKDLQLILANERFYKKLDLPPERFPTGCSFESIIRFNAERGEYGEGDVDEQVRSRVELAGIFKEHRIERVRPNGTILEIRGVPLGEGGFVTTYLDVTERKRAEQEAIRSRERLYSAIEAITEGFVLYDADERLVLCNEKYKALYAESSDLFVPGARFEDIVRIGAERGQYADAIGRVDEWVAERIRMFRNPDTAAFEQRLGNDQWLLVGQYRTPEGGTVGIRVDITERKLTEEKLLRYQHHLEDIVAERTALVEEQAARLAEALEREKQVTEMQRLFISMASHEFRTPLAVIDGAAQRLVRRAAAMAPEEIAARSQKIRDAVTQMIGLMDSTLAAERSEAARHTAKNASCAIRALVLNCCSQMEYVSTSHRISLDLGDLPDEIPADPAAIESVITNLLSNAVKYSPNGDEVRVSACKAGDFVELSIADNGVGIGEADMPRIFTRYFRAASATGIPGTGIGLSLAKMIVEDHGGEIVATSVIDRGSTFILRLPMNRAAEEPLSKAS